MKKISVAGVTASMLVAAAVGIAPSQAGPGCMQALGWGGFCDGPTLPDGTHWHEQNVLGFWQSGYACPDFTPQNQHWAPC